MLNHGRALSGAVLGSPISHSLSPLLHNEIFQLLGLTGKYVAQEVKAGELATFLRARSDDFTYLSLTMPLKEEALKLGLPVEASVIVAASANTLVKVESGWQLYSTDGLGFRRALTHSGISTLDRVLILGAGATARSIAQVLDPIAKSIDILGRSRSREGSFSELVKKSDFNFLSWSNQIEFSDFDLVINTTPAGAADSLAERVEKPVATLFDVLYSPWPTALAKRWSDSGAQVISGSELLLYQGLEQIHLVSGVDFDFEELAAPLRKSLNRALL